MSRKRAFVYVQHLLGIGHLVRAAALARALAAQGLEVTLASGGMPLAGLATGGVRLLQLPPAAASDPSFRNLVDERGQPVDEAWRSRRSEALLSAWRAFEPHALVIELFPFGRRQMRFELLPLLQAARAAARRPVIVCSVRDVLGGGQHDPSRQAWMLDAFEGHFDHLLVHGDPAFLPFERTFMYAGRLGDRLHYTGYVVDDQAAGARGEAGAGEVIVSAGGGAVGAGLLEAALRARPLSVLARHPWRLLAGINADPGTLQSLAALASAQGCGQVVVERSRDDFAALLANCALSVSQAGYNTLMQVLQAGARAVVVPFAGGGESEQTLRARLLAQRGRVELVEEPGLNPHVLAAAVDRAAGGRPPARGGVDLGGAARSAALIRGWAAELAW